MRFLLDTAVVVYARERDHPYRASCRRLVELARDGIILPDASVELVQEYAHVLLRRGLAAPDVAASARDVSTLCRLLAFDEDVLERTLMLLDEDLGLGGRDAVHAATALVHGIELVVSPDRAFASVPGLRRLDPAEAEATLLG